MAGMQPPAFHPMDHARPAPLGGRRSPPPPGPAGQARYSRSPSPPPSGDDSYGGRRHRNRGDRYSRNISPDRYGTKGNFI